MNEIERKSQKQEVRHLSNAHYCVDIFFIAAKSSWKGFLMGKITFKYNENHTLFIILL